MEKREKKRRGLMLLAPVVLIVGLLAVIVITDGRPHFNGSSVKNPDCYLLEFTSMHRTDSHELELQAGDVLAVDFDIPKGRVHMTVGIDGQETIYRADRMDWAKFELGIPESGTYRITGTAEHAAGEIHIRVKE